MRCRSPRTDPASSPRSTSVKSTAPCPRAAMSREHAVGEEHGAGHVEIDEAQMVLDVRLDERAGDADAGVDRPPPRAARAWLAQRSSTASTPRRVARSAWMAVTMPSGVSAQARRHLLDLVILGDDHDVVPVRDELLGQCESDPAGRPGHERESCTFSVALHQPLRAPWSAATACVPRQAFHAARSANHNLRNRGHNFSRTRCTPFHIDASPGSPRSAVPPSTLRSEARDESSDLARQAATSESTTSPTRSSRSPPTRSCRVTSTGLCGSDLHLYEVLGPFLGEGDVLGHEPMGIVEEVGAEVDGPRRPATGW